MATMMIDDDSITAADPSLEVGEIGDILGFHIRLAHGTVYRHFMDTFSDLGLTQKQVSVLWLIHDHPGIAQSDLSRRLRMDRATTMAVVNRLAARGYLERGRSAEDARKQPLHLLDGGVCMLNRAKEAVLAHEAWLKARFKPREVTKLIELLSRIHG